MGAIRKDIQRGGSEWWLSGCAYPRSTGVYYSRLESCNVAGIKKTYLVLFRYNSHASDISRQTQKYRTQTPHARGRYFTTYTHLSRVSTSTPHANIPPTLPESYLRPKSNVYQIHVDECLVIRR